MKQAICLLLLFSAGVYCSCSNKAVQSPQVNSKVLTGVWELRSAFGGMMIYNPDDYAPGNGNRWIFSQTSFQNTYNDSVQRSGTYTISRGTGRDDNTGRAVDQLIINNQPGDSFELKDDTLRFYYGPVAADGVIQYYLKISDDTTTTSLR